MQKSQESQQRRLQRMQNIKVLRTRVAVSKKLYNREKVKQQLNRGDF